MDDYKKYSLEQLENWIHDAISCSEATPQEIYDTIKKAVEEEYYAYKHRTGQAYELLALLNGNTIFDAKGNQISIMSCDKDDPSPECKGAWNSFWEENYYPEEYTQYTEEELNAMCDHAESTHKKTKKTWDLFVEVDGLSGDCFVVLPDDLLSQLNWNEGDTIEWIDNLDGSLKIRKQNEK